MKRVIILFVSLFILGVNVGCDFGLSDPEKKPQPFICDLDGYTMAACTPTSGYACRTLVNRTDQEITAVYATLSSNNSWGGNILVTSFPACSFIVITFNTSDTWDMVVERTDGYEAYLMNEIVTIGYSYYWNIDSNQFTSNLIKSEGEVKALPSE